MTLRRDLVELIGGDPLSFYQDERPEIRRLAVSLSSDRLHRPSVRRALTERLAADPDVEVRAEAAELLGRCGSSSSLPILKTAIEDPESRVVESAVTALGELGDPEALPELIELATGHPDKLVRESAVAALGAIGDERALPVLLSLLGEGPPQVRRRAVVALTVFDDPEVEPAIAAARLDRNPMVREAAEMVVGRG